MRKDFIYMALVLFGTLFASFLDGMAALPTNRIETQDTRETVPLGDPFILLHKGTYYAYGTHSDSGIEVYTSKDLKKWKLNGLALNKDDVWADRWFWAPEVYEVNGKFYMYYSADEHICVAISNSPLGPFKQEKQQPIIVDEHCIDNSLFIDDNGKAYLFFVRFNDGNNVWVVELEDDLMTAKKETMHHCIHVSQKWEEVQARVNEGPFVIKRKGVYYMTYSANHYESQQYGVGCATATDIMGNWNKYEENPILQSPGELVGAGHHAMFTDKAGKLRIVYHAHKDKKNIHPRAMHIGEVSFKKTNGVDRMRISKTYITPEMDKSSKKKYDVAAYIWPAYHNEPRFKDINVFPDGKGEWEAVYKAKPKFEGHRQPRVPLWGYLDEADPKVQAKKIDTALKYGVNTFIFDWYWYDNKPFLENVLNNGFLKAKNNKKMNFYLMWANHTHTAYLDPKEPDKNKVYWRGEVSPSIFEGFTDHLINDYFKRSNYYKIDGKPVFAIYELGTFINGMGGQEEARKALEKFRQKCIDAGLPGLHLQAILWGAIPESLSAVPGDKSQTQDNTVKLLGFNSLTNYQWCHFVPANQDYEKWGEAATARYTEFDNQFSAPYFPHVSIDWDNNPRFPGPAQGAVSGVTPQKFERFLYKAKDFVDKHPDQPRLVTINAWNEWAEGSYLEPDTTYKYGFLEAVKKVFK